MSDKYPETIIPSKRSVGRVFNTMAHYSPSKNGFMPIEKQRELFNDPLRLYEHNYHTAEIKHTNRGDEKLCCECESVPGDHLHHSELSFGEMRNFAINIAINQNVDEVYESLAYVQAGKPLGMNDGVARAFSWFYAQNLVRFQWLCVECHEKLHTDRQKRFAPIRGYLRAIDNQFRVRS